MTMATRERTPFGERLHEARKAAGLTQEKAAEVVGISQGTLAELERSALSSKHLVPLAVLYGVDPRWLASGEVTNSGDVRGTSMAVPVIADAISLLTPGVIERLGAAAGHQQLGEMRPMVAAALVLSRALLEQDELTRESLAPLVARLIKTPEEAPRIIALIDAIAVHSEGKNPPEDNSVLTPEPRFGNGGKS